MTIIVHEKRSVKNIRTLSQELETVLSGLTEEQAKLVKEKHIRDELALNKSYDAWEPLRFYGYKNDLVLASDNALVSIRGLVAYDFGEEMHITTGNPNYEYPVVNIPIFRDASNIGVSRLIACTFLTIPDKYQGISYHDLEVFHLNGQSYQTHFCNLEWQLNKSDINTTVIEETVKMLHAELPTQD